MSFAQLLVQQVILLRWPSPLSLPYLATLLVGHYLILLINVYDYLFRVIIKVE